MTTTPTKPRVYRKLDDQLIEKICAGIAAGNYTKIACALAAVPEETFYDWLRRAVEDGNNGLTAETSKIMQLSQSVKEAESKREAVMVERLLSAAMPGERKRVKKLDKDGQVIDEEVTETGGDWLAAATYLERRYPDRWARKDRQTVTIDEHKTVQVTVIVKHYVEELPVPPGETLRPGSGQVVEGECKELPPGGPGE